MRKRIIWKNRPGVNGYGDVLNCKKTLNQRLIMNKKDTLITQEELQSELSKMQKRLEKLEAFRERTSIIGREIGKARIEIEAEEIIGNSSYGLSNASRTRRVTNSRFIKVKIEGKTVVLATDSKQNVTVCVGPNVNIRTIDVNTDTKMEDIEQYLSHFDLV